MEEIDATTVMNATGFVVGIDTPTVANITLPSYNHDPEMQELCLQDYVGIEAFAGNSEIRVYPNPATDQINFEIPSSTYNGCGTYSMYTLGGQKFFQLHDKVGDAPIALPSLPTGPYFHRFSSGGRTLYSGILIIE
jgi:hypothetical protein